MSIILPGQVRYEDDPEKQKPGCVVCQRPIPPGSLWSTYCSEECISKPIDEAARKEKATRFDRYVEKLEGL